MNKFSEIINESINLDEVKKSLTYINAVLGYPDVSTFKMNEEEGYVFRWSLDFELDEYQGVSEIIRLLEIIRSVNNLSDSNIILDKFRMDFKIDEKLFIRLTPESISEIEDYS